MTTQQSEVAHSRVDDEEQEELFSQIVSYRLMLGVPLEALDLSNGFKQALLDWGEAFVV